MTDARDPAGTDAGRRDASERKPTADDASAKQPATGGGDPDDLDADDAVEADSLETLDPENPPA